ncbi:MAG: ABC transporter permease, partial [Oscillospiraceae bacterium]
LIISKVNPSYPFVGSYASIPEYFQRIALPSVALAFVMIALACRVTRSSMIEQQAAPYTQTAISKGVPDSRIIWKHNLKNAIIPVIAVVSIQIGGMVVGAVLVENVFSLAGLGTLLVDAIKSSDYNVVQGITMLLIFMFLVISMLVDILYALIDPRIRSK